MAKRSVATGAAGFVRAVEQALEPLADARRASEMSAYMRGQFEYLGVQTPVRRRAVRPLVRAYCPAGAEELRQAAELLWKKREREFQYAGVDLLVRRRALLELPDLEWLFELARKKSWWDTVDALAKVCGDVAGRAGRQGARRMDWAIEDESLWVRRIALLHQLGRGEATDTGRLFGYAQRLAGEKEFFIRKAIGWALRDYAWYDWRAVEAFLGKNGGELSGLSVREARKNLAALESGSAQPKRAKAARRPGVRGERK